VDRVAKHELLLSLVGRWVRLFVKDGSGQPFAGTLILTNATWAELQPSRGAPAGRYVVFVDAISAIGVGEE